MSCDGWEPRGSMIRDYLHSGTKSRAGKPLSRPDQRYCIFPLFLYEGKYVCLCVCVCVCVSVSVSVCMHTCMRVCERARARVKGNFFVVVCIPYLNLKPRKYFLNLKTVVKYFLE